MDLTKRMYDKVKTKVNFERLEKLENYYKGEHAIANRSKDADLKNNKITVNNAAYITDTNVGYIVGNPIQYQVDEANEPLLEPIIDEYEKQAINKIDTALARHLSIYGQAYEYVYAFPNIETGVDFKSAVIRPTNAYILTDLTVEDNPLWGCFWVKRIDNTGPQDTEYYDVTFVDDREVKTYIFKNEQLTLDSQRSHLHFFGKVPLIKYKNNEIEQGDFEKVISIIDALNMLQSDRINDKEQLVSAIMTIYGATVDDEDMDSIKKNRLMMLPQDAKAEYLIKALNEGEIETLKKSLENDLHKISMTPNMSDENFAGNNSGVALSYKLLPFEQNAKNKASYLEQGLKYRLECYSNAMSFLNKVPGILKANQIDVIFTHNLPVNQLELAQIVSMLNGIVDTKTLLSTLPFVKDVDGAIEALEKEKKEKALAFGFNNQPFNDPNDKPTNKVDDSDESSE